MSTENKKNINLLKQHYQLLTTDFSKSLVPNFKKSKLVSFSCLFIIIPLFFIPGNGIISYFFRILCLLQVPIAYLSDYTFAPDCHIIHGIDRITATICLILFLGITFLYNSFKDALVIITIPIIAILSAKYYCNIEDEFMYNVTQFIWHLSTSLLVAYVFYKIKKKEIKF
tara:strand:+ start:969 stop:1478 length:510 start_codon:yes stop_codon:yes gene_type:complete